MFVISLSCEIAEAADSGFYIGAAGGRSTQRLDKQAGVGPIPTATFTPPDPLVPGAPYPRLGEPPYTFLPFPVDGPAYRVLLPDGLSADETDVGWNVALGYRVNKYLAAELAYVDSGEASLVEHYRSVPSGSPVAVREITRSYTVTSSGPAVTVLGSLPLSSQWEVFVRGGVLFAEQEVETRTRAVSGSPIVAPQVDRSFSDQVVTVGAGVQWAFLPRWTARLEYQRTDDLQANEIMGESRIDQASLSVLFGL
ncbi:outer membrane beta-barrel protein [Steroidobacter cummioxidans]|uniref:outer membrane beta-barrel protein n=1 Tax=Steroidobacter cummioxidans TaxID=1803913 RepID=UPI0013794F19|nr:outer membrane beta-barrel protein [Steroidobacter cummioxidans]